MFDILLLHFVTKTIIYVFVYIYQYPIPISIKILFIMRFSDAHVYVNRETYIILYRRTDTLIGLII